MAVCLQMELEYRSWGVHTDMHEVPPGQNGVCIKKKKKSREKQAKLSPKSSLELKVSNNPLFKPGLSGHL